MHEGALAGYHHAAQARRVMALAFFGRCWPVESMRWDRHSPTSSVLFQANLHDFEQLFELWFDKKAASQSNGDRW